MVMAGWSVYLTKLFPGQLEQAVNQYFVHILSLVTDNNIDGWLRMGLLPPLGNFADISYFVEN